MKRDIERLNNGGMVGACVLAILLQDGILS